MLTKVSILSPFRYEYNGRRSWVGTGESLYLDTSNKDQRAELLYILSSNFPFKEFVHIDVKALPSDLQCEVKDNKGFYNLPVTPMEIIEEPKKTEFFRPLGEAEDNKFIKPIVIEVIKDPEDEPLIETTVQEECLEEEEPINPAVAKAIDSRRKELLNTPWLRVKEIAEEYGIIYTNKAEAGELIIDREFS